MTYKATDPSMDEWNTATRSKEVTVQWNRKATTGHLITGLAGSTWSMFTAAHSALTTYNCVKLHYSAYSLPQEEGRKKGPRQEIYISQSLCIDTWEWEWITISSFLTNQFFFFKSMAINNKMRSLLISPTTISDESPEYTVREICFPNHVTAGHHTLPPPLIQNLDSLFAGFGSSSLGTLTVNATVASCFSHQPKERLSERGKEICSHVSKQWLEQTHSFSS